MNLNLSPNPMALDLPTRGMQAAARHAFQPAQDAFLNVFQQSAFSGNAYSPQTMSAVSATDAACAPSANSAMLATLAAQAQQAEAEAAHAEMQYFLSKRKAAMAAARAAAQNYQLLQQSMTEQAQAQAHQQHQQRQVSSVAASSTAPVPTDRVDPTVSDALTSMRQAEIEAVGAFLDLARGPTSSKQPQLAVTATVPQQQARVAVKPFSAATNAPIGMVTAITPEPSQQARAAIEAATNTEAPALISKAVTPEPWPKVSSHKQLHPPSLPPIELAAVIETYRNGIGSTTKQKKKKAKKASPSEPPKSETPKPKRFFTAYNIFFAVEREKILRAVPSDCVLGEDRDARVQAVVSLLETSFAREEEASLEEQVASKVLKDQCVYVAGKVKRKHRKSHGKVGFVDMTYIISRRWKALPNEKVAWYKALGKLDLKRFQKAMDEHMGIVKK